MSIVDLQAVVGQSVPVGTQPFVAAAAGIGDALLRQANTSSDGLLWPIQYPTDGRGLVWQHPENLFSGASGGALFLANLFCHTQDTTYLDAALRTMRWTVAYCRKTPTYNYGFYTGRIGVSYTLLYLFGITQQQSLLNEAIQLITPTLDGYLQNAHTTNSLFTGRAGTLLVLTQLYEASGDTRLLTQLMACVDHILAGAKLDTTGIYWDRSHHTVRGLCGFGHGAAGIGYAFLELSRCIPNKAFDEVARLAFAYENSQWCPTAKNWPDYRKDITDLHTQQRYERAYLANDQRFFAGSYTNLSWAHGAAGIGLTRLRAKAHLPNESYQADIESARHLLISRHRSLTTQPLTLRQQSAYDGLVGESAFLLEDYRVTQHQPSLAAVQHLAMHLLHQTNELANVPNDCGLLTGLAGLGYYFLQVARPDADDSVWLPRLPRSEASSPAYGELAAVSAATIRQKLIMGTFPRTVALLTEVAPDTWQRTCEPTGTLLSGAAFLDDALRVADLLPEHSQYYVGYIVVLDKWRFDMLGNLNNAYSNMQERFADVAINELLNLGDDVLLRTPIKLNDAAVLLRTKHDEQLLQRAGGRLDEDTLTAIIEWFGSQAVVLLPSSHDHVQAHPLFVELLIFSKLTQPATPEVVCNELEQLFLPNTESFRQKMAYATMLDPGENLSRQFKRLLLQLVRKYIEAGVLVPVAA